eukprot:7534791-Pyramimonas_sp.AAC.1
MEAVAPRAMETLLATQLPPNAVAADEATSSDDLDPQSQAAYPTDSRARAKNKCAHLECNETPEEVKAM